ncbi:hypothetical protein JX266_014036 [Neoarthrinium moseri]|uniref:uncharacterized protein n=1 Tax=Neoarthrinium moseri TaxID=1658444 RepID=UPI001FDC5472|nr:uncharacterized protein JN550_007920 [Neoarthrinium moseri]KAI1839754.1 hypothetical protein JX266_014036 [Neoarthrinium moseri]KAI1865942.1 hypothetical protein JN550_007920 [Neoarthrinium moseri]
MVRRARFPSRDSDDSDGSEEIDSGSEYESSGHSTDGSESTGSLDDFVVSDSDNDLGDIQVFGVDGHDGIDDTPSDTAERIPQGDLNTEQDIGPDALASLSKAFGKLQDALVLLKTTINSLEAERKP